MKQKHKSSRNEYFEAIIQLRPLNKELYDYVMNDISKNNIQVAKEDVFKHGFDIQVDSNKYAVALGKKLKKVFNGEIKLTRTLHTVHRLTSKNLYRVTMLFRLKEKKEEEV